MLERTPPQLIPRQYLLPGFQGEFRVPKYLDRVPCDRISNPGLIGRITVFDVARVLVELRISPNDQAARALIIEYRRVGYLHETDIHAGACLIGCFRRPEFNKRFMALYGARIGPRNLYRAALGGWLIDPENANFPRSDEEEQADRDELDDRFDHERDLMLV